MGIVAVRECTPHLKPVRVEKVPKGLTRSTPLARTPMKRGTSRLVTTKPMRQRSARSDAYARELDRITPALLARSGGVCEIHGCGAAAVRRHHRLMRSQGGRNTLANLLHLCSFDHDRIHAHPAESYAAGWLIRSRPEGAFV